MVSLPATAPGGLAPETASTLNDALNWHVSATPDRTHIRILDDVGGPVDLTYAALHQEAAAVAAGLIAHDVMPGETVAIMLPTCRAYFVTFAGVVLAGAVPVPVYPPARPSQLADHLRRTAGILANAGPRCWSPCPRPLPSATCCARTSKACVTSSSPNPSRAQAKSAAPSTTTSRRPRAGAIHLGQHRAAQRGRAHAPEPARQHSGDGSGLRRRPGRTRSSVGCRCITTWV